MVNNNGRMLMDLCRDHKLDAVNTWHKQGGPTYWNELGGKEVSARLDYILMPSALREAVHSWKVRGGRLR